MAGDVLYLRVLTDQAAASGLPATEQSGSMSASSTPALGLMDLLLDQPPAGSGGALAACRMLSNTNQQRAFMTKHVTAPLGVASIPAAAWTLAIAGNESDPAIQGFIVPVIYIVSGTSVLGSVYDQDANVGSVMAGTAMKGHVITIAGAAVGGITPGTDRLVLEVWVRAHPSAAIASPLVHTRWDGSTPVQDGVLNTSPLSLLQTPVVGLIETTGTGAAASAAHGATSIAASIPTSPAVGSVAHGATSVTGSTTSTQAAAAGSAARGVTRVMAQVAGSQPGGAAVDDLTEDCWGGAQPWLLFNGVEIANLGRVRSYAQRLTPGLAQWGCPPNPIVYRAGGQALDVFVSPDSDPAPWYDPAYPESSEFFGVCLEPAIDVPLDRQNTELLRNGAWLGPLRLKERTLTATGFLFASTHRGLEYGKHWLLDKTMRGDCSHGCDLVLYLASPPIDESNDDAGRYTLRRVGVQSVDVTDQVTPFADCTIVFDVGDPLLYKSPRVVLPFATMPFVNVPVQPGGCIAFADWFCGTPAASLQARVDAPPFGELATILIIDATAEGINGVVIEVLADCADDTSVISSATVGELEMGSVFVLDSAREQATYYRADGTIEDGTRLLDLPDGVGVPWVVVASGGPSRCLAVRRARYCSQGFQTQVEVQTLQRLV